MFSRLPVSANVHAVSLSTFPKRIQRIAALRQFGKPERQPEQRKAKFAPSWNEPRPSLRAASYTSPCVVQICTSCRGDQQCVQRNAVSDIAGQTPLVGIGHPAGIVLEGEIRQFFTVEDQGTRQLGYFTGKG